MEFLNLNTRSQLKGLVLFLSAMIYVPRLFAYDNNNHYQSEIEEAQKQCIVLNNHYNSVFKNFSILWLTSKTEEEFEKYKLCVEVLGELLNDLIKVNKSLGIDCGNYDEDGNIIYTPNEKDEMIQMERLPNKLRLK